MTSVQPFLLNLAEMYGQALMIPEDQTDGINFAEFIQPPSKAVLNVPKVKPTIKVDPKVEEILTGLVEAHVPFQALQITESGDAVIVGENQPKVIEQQIVNSNPVKSEDEVPPTVSHEFIGQSNAKVMIAKEPTRLVSVTPLPLDHETVKAIQSEFADEHTIKIEAAEKILASAAPSLKTSMADTKTEVTQNIFVKQISPQSAPEQIRISFNPQSGHSDSGADFSSQQGKAQATIKQLQQQPMEFTQVLQKPVENKISMVESQTVDVAANTQKDFHIVKQISTEPITVKDTMPQVLTQIVPKIHEATRDGVEKITVQLSPKSLGMVEVQLAITKDGRIDAVISAHNADTADLLSRNAKTLELALQDSGFDSDLSFTHHDQEGSFSQASADSKLKEARDANQQDEEINSKTQTRSANLDKNRALDIHA